MVARLSVAGFAMAMAGCAIVADPAAYRGWNYRQFNAYATIPNQPLCGVPGAGPDCVAPDPALDDPQTPPRSVASSRVLWNVDNACRNHFPRRPDGSAPDRREVLNACWPRAGAEQPSLPDENFVSLSISGGGNRSAVFGTEAMFALDQWKLLDEVDVISGVSGGSFPAVLYAMSCDANGAYCDEARSGESLRWQYSTISERLARNLGTAYVLKRFSPDDIFERFTTHRTTANVLSDTLAEELFYQPNGNTDIRFKDLNPRRPNLILNATDVSIDRQYLEKEGKIPADALRTGLLGDRSHFAFTDYYFEELLRSDLSRVPAAYAAAASAAFPLIIDMPTLGRFSPLALSPNEPSIDFIHLTDGSIHDNTGLAEVDLILRGIFNRSATDRPNGLPRRVLILILDATLNEATGVSRVDPDPRTIEAMIWPLRLLNTTNAVSVMLATASGLRKDRLEEFLASHVRRGCDPSSEMVSSDAICAQIVEIGVEHLDGYDSILRDGAFAPCDDNEAMATAGAIKRRECAVMRALKAPEVRKRLGLGDYHPQCYFEATRFAPTSFDPDPDAAICLQHAARWAVALAMAELCGDQRFGGQRLDATAGGARAAIGIDCEMTSPPLPPLQECPYEKVVNARRWTEIPRQTAHCACLEAGRCEPERLP